MWRYGLLLLALISTAVSANQPRIAEIAFAGNEVTKAILLERELSIAVGELLDVAALEESRQSIMDLGLFESVGTYVRPVPNAPSDGVIVLFRVTEKYYVLPIPRFSVNSEGDARIGLRLRWDNFMGLNQTFKLTASRRQFNDELRDDEQGYDVEYDYPAIANSLFDLNVRADVAELSLTDDVTLQNYVESTKRFELVLTRRISRGQSSGWRVGAGLLHDDLQISPAAATIQQAGKTVAAIAQLGYRDVRFLLHSEQGFAMNYRLEASVPMAAIDYQYMRQTLALNWFLPGLDQRGHHNLIARVDLGLYNGGLAADEAFGFGSSDIRGFSRSDALEGDAFWRASAEYLWPVFDWSTVRAISFVDVGEIAADQTDVCLCRVKVGVGAGIRWRPKRLVGLEIDLGVAYAVNKNEFRLVFGSNRFR